MDERAMWSVAEAESTVYSKFIDISESKVEFENSKSNALFTGVLGVLCVASAGVFEDASVTSRYDFGLLHVVDDLYGLAGVGLLGVAAHSLYNSVKYHRRMHS